MAKSCDMTLPITAAILLFVAIATQSAFANEVSEHALPGCAETACYSLLQLSGKDIPLSDVSDRFREQVPNFAPLRVSILNLRKISSSFGLETDAIRVDPRRATELPLPCILYFRPGRWSADRTGTTGHFLTIARVEGDRFRTFEWAPISSNPDLAVPISAIQNAWDGEAIVLRVSSLSSCRITLIAMAVAVAALSIILKSIRVRWPRIVSTAPLFLCVVTIIGCGRSTQQVSMDVPPIVFATPTKNFGVVDSSRLIEAKFPFTVWDRGPVKIAEISTSCTCTTANSDIIGRTLQPGSSNELILTIRPDGTPAQAVARVVGIVTDPPSKPPVVIAVTYRPCGAPQLSVAELVVEAEPGKDATTQFDITHHRAPADRQVKLKRSESEFGDFVFQSATTKTEEFLVRDLAEQKLMIDTTEVRLRSTGKHGYGEFRSLVKLIFENETSITLPAIIRVRHPFAFAVNRVFCGRLKSGQDWAISVPFRRVNSRVEIERIDCDPSTIHAELKEHAVIVSGTSPQEPGRFEGDVTVRFQGDALPKVVIPLSGIVIEDE